jgi:hypothetical protein
MMFSSSSQEYRSSLAFLNVASFSFVWNELEHQHHSHFFFSVLDGLPFAWTLFPSSLCHRDWSSLILLSCLKPVWIPWRNRSISDLYFELQEKKQEFIELKTLNFKEKTLLDSAFRFLLFGGVSLHSSNFSTNEKKNKNKYENHLEGAAFPCAES